MDATEFDLVKVTEQDLKRAPDAAMVMVVEKTTEQRSFVFYHPVDFCSGPGAHRGGSRHKGNAQDAGEHSFQTLKTLKLNHFECCT